MVPQLRAIRPRPPPQTTSPSSRACPRWSRASSPTIPGSRSRPPPPSASSSPSSARPPSRRSSRLAWCPTLSSFSSARRSPSSSSRLRGRSPTSRPEPPRTPASSSIPARSPSSSSSSDRPPTTSASRRCGPSATLRATPQSAAISCSRRTRFTRSWSSSTSTPSSRCCGTRRGRCPTFAAGSRSRSLTSSATRSRRSRDWCTAATRKSSRTRAGRCRTSPTARTIRSRP
mmetsp:Transcript_139389/g.338633  ORF Transcript_139389/g.338633 Transcript_139389/m.338633 type:complete len:230 (+) Transcript_139389:224-913(+)